MLHFDFQCGLRCYSLLLPSQSCTHTVNFFFVWFQTKFPVERKKYVSKNAVKWVYPNSTINWNSSFVQICHFFLGMYYRSSNSLTFLTNTPISPKLLMSLQNFWNQGHSISNSSPNSCSILFLLAQLNTVHAKVGCSVGSDGGPVPLIATKRTAL